MADFRIQTEFFTHPKTLKLIRLAGKVAPFTLVRLWGYATEQRPDGDLSGIEDADLEAIVGAKAGFLQHARKAGFLDDSRLHDWQEHQPWVVGATTRSDAARKAARCRWDAPRMRTASKPQCGLDAPSPSPSPSPTEEDPPTPREPVPTDTDATPDPRPPQAGDSRSNNGTPRSAGRKRRGNRTPEAKLYDDRIAFWVSKGSVQPKADAFKELYDQKTGQLRDKWRGQV